MQIEVSFLLFSSLSKQKQRITLTYLCFNFSDMFFLSTDIFGDALIVFKVSVLNIEISVTLPVFQLFSDSDILAVERNDLILAHDPGHDAVGELVAHLISRQIGGNDRAFLPV